MYIYKNQISEPVPIPFGLEESYLLTRDVQHGASLSRTCTQRTISLMLLGIMTKYEVNHLHESLQAQLICQDPISLSAADTKIGSSTV